jgi:hypothetical protein
MIWHIEMKQILIQTNNYLLYSELYLFYLLLAPPVVKYRARVSPSQYFSRIYINVK